MVHTLRVCRHIRSRYVALDLMDDLGLLHGWADFRHHLSVILGPASEDYRVWDSTLAGHAAMAGQAIVHLAFLIGIPAAVVSIYGV